MKNGNSLAKLFQKKSAWVVLVLAVLLAVLPLFIKNKFVISTLVYSFLFASFGVAWNIIGGYGAQISWCHSAFAACGAYTTFLFYYYLGISPFFTMPVGMLIAYLMATLIGRGTFKLRGRQDLPAALQGLHGRFLGPLDRL